MIILTIEIIIAIMVLTAVIIFYKKNKKIELLMEEKQKRIQDKNLDKALINQRKG